MERTLETFSRSCWMSSGFTPSGTDSRRMEPLFLTTVFVNIRGVKRRKADLTKWNSTRENHNGNPQTHTWIGIKPPLVLRLPDNRGGNYDSNIVECIADNVNQDTHHSEIMAVSGLGGVNFVAVVFVF